MTKPKLIVTLIILILIWLSIIGYIFYNTSKQTKMIDLIGKSYEEVKEYAEKYKLNLKFEEDYSNDIDRDLVMRQNILVNTILSEGDTLVITMSLGGITQQAYYDHQVNELGQIPIMMYHGISNIKNIDTAYTNGNVTKDGYTRTAEAFRNDLEFYYQNNYQMISLKDLVGGKIDVELGKSPIVLTFDDGLANNINVTGIDNNGDIIIDPNSAVGILESFKEKYPDYNITATFFLNKNFFNQEYNDKIIKWLIDHNYDIGNHTYNHFDLSNLNCTQTQIEVGRMYDELSKITNQYVKIVSLPYGSPNEKEHSNFNCILNSSYNNKNYDSITTLSTENKASYSPFSTDYISEILPRIKAYDNNGDDDIAYHFKKLEDIKYISDGDVKKIVIKKEDEKKLNNEYDLEVIRY